MKILQQHLWRSTLAALLALVFMATVEPVAFAQVDKWGAWENGVTESWWLSSRDFTNEQAVEAIQRWKRIGVAGESALENSWAGDYFSGSDTHGTYVRWSPQEGFLIANVDKCQALVMDVTYGRVEVTSTLIRFLPEFSKSASKSHGHSHPKERDRAVMPFVPIKWRGQLLLIPEDGIEDFSDYVAGLGDYNALNEIDLEGSYFFSKLSGNNSVSAETPLVPSQYERFLKKPITAAVTAVEGRRLKRNFTYTHTSKMLSFTTQHELASLTFVRLNVGNADGVKEGLFLRVVAPNVGEVVRLIEVGPKSSRGIVVRGVDEKGRELFYDNESQHERAYPRVTVGWKLSTAQRW